MDFSEALLKLKEGKKIARKGWNGKDMYLFLTPDKKIPASEWIGAKPTGISVQDEYIHIHGHIDMKTAEGYLSIGWVAGQADLLADDWVIYSNCIL